MSAIGPLLLNLTGQQNALHEALSDKDQKLASMYLGALKAFEQSANPEMYVHAAHSMRELMEKMPQYLDLPVEEHIPSLKERTRYLADNWVNGARRSGCFSADSGEIGHPFRFLSDTCSDHIGHSRSEATLAG
jgi:hypothetical protein